MPIQYVLLERGSFVYARAYGRLTTQDLVAHEEALLNDASLVEGYRQLLDCRWATEDATDLGVLDDLASVHLAHATMVKGSRYAIVAHSLQWFRIGAQYRCERFGMTMIIFNDPSTACIWLGIDYRQLADYRRSRLPLFAPTQAVPIAGAAV